MCVALSQALVVCALVAQPSLILCDPTDSSPPYSSVCGIPRQEYSSGLSFPSQGIFLTQGLNLHLLNGQVGSLPLSHLVSQVKYCILLKHYFSHYCKNKEWHFLKQNSAQILNQLRNGGLSQATVKMCSRYMTWILAC